jgi:hypothetical protein
LLYTFFISPRFAVSLFIGTLLDSTCHCMFVHKFF